MRTPCAPCWWARGALRGSAADAAACAEFADSYAAGDNFGTLTGKVYGGEPGVVQRILVRPLLPCARCSRC